MSAESRFTISFDGSSGNLDQILNALKSSFRATVSDLQKTANQVELFTSLATESKKLGDAIDQAKAKVDQLKASMDAVKAAGGTVTRDMVTELRNAERALGTLNTQQTKNVQQLAAMSQSLKAAGVDTRNLAAEEVRLADAIKKANAAAVEQSNKDLLGLKNTAPQIAQLTTAFNSLVATGKLSMGEVSLASENLRKKVAELRDEAGSLGSAFTAARGALLGITVALAGAGAAAAKTASDYRAFAQGMAAVNTIAEVSGAKIAELTDGVRSMARTMGVDAVASTKALYDIIGSGISPDNSIAVLTLATKAAIAGITDVTTAAKVGVSILNAYGLEVTQLERVYDILFKTVRDGVVSFPELAQNIGEVLPTARSAKVSLEEVGSAMVVLTRNGIPAAEAVTALTRTIQDLAAPGPEAAKVMQSLNLEFNGLVDTIEQLAKKQLSLGQLRELIPDVRAVKGVQILVQNYRLLRDEIGEMNKEAATMQSAYAIMAATPQAQVDRFNSSIKDLSIAIGQFVTGTGGLITALTSMINSFNTLAPATKTAAFEITAIGLAFGAAFFALARLTPALNLLGAALFGNTAAMTAFGTSITLASAAMIALQAAFAGFLGFKFGQELSKNSESVRFFGDLLGVAAGRVDNLATFLTARLSASLSGNTEAADKARAAYRANLLVLDEMQKAIETGVTAKLYTLQVAFEALQKRLGEVSAAATKAATDLQSGVTSIAATVKGQVDAVDASISNLNTRLTNLIAKLTENVATAQTLTQAAIANINAESAARIAGLDQSAAAELKTAAAVIEITKKAADDRIKVIQDGAKEVLKAFDAEAEARIDTAKRTTGNLAKVEQEILLTKRGILATIIGEYRTHINGLIAEDQRRLAKIKELEDQRRGINESIEEKIRAAQRETMSIVDQYYDKQKQAEELLSKARAEFAKGNIKLAEEYANKAIGLTDGLVKEVKDGEKVVIDAYSAQQTAVDLYKSAQDVLIQAVNKRQRAEEEGHKSAQAALEESKKGLADYQKQYDEVAAKAAAGLQVQITANSEAVQKTLSELDKQITEQARVMQISGNAQLAKLEIDRLKAELDKGITVNVDARTDKITTALKAIEKDAPELTVRVDTALAQIETVKKSAREIESVQMQINSNAKEVQAQIDKLKEPTSSTHTIYVEKVERNQTGGPVGAGSGPQPVVGLNRGGFPRPAWSKVPGSGSGDIVRAALREGSFVVRKAASRYYGDDLMHQVAHGYAKGGSVKRKPPVDIDGIPSTAIIGYAQGLLPYLRHPMWRQTVEIMAADLQQWQSSNGKAKGALVQMLAAARSVAANYPLQEFYGKTVSGGGGTINTKPLQSFESFFERWKIQHEKDNVDEDAEVEQKVAERLQAIAVSARSSGVPWTNFNTGGEVNAMLEPGEWVVKEPAVRKYGGGLMHMINQMLIPREALAAMLSPPTIPRFHTGGPVNGPVPALPAGSPMMWQQPDAQRSGNAYSVNINANAGDILSAENVRRFVLPVIDAIERRSR